MHDGETCNKTTERQIDNEFCRMHTHRSIKTFIRSHLPKSVEPNEKYIFRRKFVTNVNRNANAQAPRLKSNAVVEICWCDLNVGVFHLWMFVYVRVSVLERDTKVSNSTKVLFSHQLYGRINEHKTREKRKSDQKVVWKFKLMQALTSDADEPTVWTWKCFSFCSVGFISIQWRVFENGFQFGNKLSADIYCWCIYTGTALTKLNGFVIRKSFCSLSFGWLSFIHSIFLFIFVSLFSSFILWRHIQRCAVGSEIGSDFLLRLIKTEKSTSNWNFSGFFFFVHLFVIGRFRRAAVCRLNAVHSAHYRTSFRVSTHTHHIIIITRT